jgi:hypothetical protein
MGCQKEIAAEIVGRGGHYVLAAKENQPHLYEDIERAFDEALDQGEPGVDFTECRTEEVRSGRQETRCCCVITDPKGIRDAGLWAGLTAIVMVISHRVVHGVASLEIRYFIGSTAGTAEEDLRWVRGHWGIEIPQSEDPRGDNLCAAGRPGYHRRGSPARAGRVVRPATTPRSQLMFAEEFNRVPPRARPPRRSD